MIFSSPVEHPAQTSALHVVKVQEATPSDTSAQATPPNGPSAQVPNIDQLLNRMVAGDREAAAEFLLRYGSRIRRRIRGKLGADMRRLFDSLEIMSTLGRRLDLYVMTGRFQAAQEDQLWNLLFKMADNALVDKGRIMARLNKVETEDSNFARLLSLQLKRAEKSHGADIEIEQCLKALRDPIDRRVLSLWFAGEPLSQIAEFVSLAPEAVRKRWEHIKTRLRDRIELSLQQ